MKKLLVMLCCFCSLNSFSYTLKTNNLDVSMELSNYKYREPGLMKLKGRPWEGVNLKYTLWDEEMFSSPVSFALDFRYMTGKNDYDGASQGGTPKQDKDIRDYYYEGRVLFGSAYAWEVAQLDLFPYLGIGYRYLVDKMDKYLSTGGYRRESQYVYMPIGLDVSKDFGGGLSLKINGEFDWLLGGHQKSGLSDYFALHGYQAEDLENEQKEGYGVRLGATLSQEIGAISLFVEGFWRYWHIQNSELNYSIVYKDGTPVDVFAGVEPLNKTQEIGIKFGIKF